MAIRKKPNQNINAAALEKSLPTLTKKLQRLQEDLSEDEKAVFSSIVSSAALHLQAMEALGDIAEISYLKPISAAATLSVRKHLVKLPKTLGLTESSK